MSIVRRSVCVQYAPLCLCKIVKAARYKEFFNRFFIAYSIHWYCTIENSTRRLVFAQCAIQMSPVNHTAQGIFIFASGALSVWRRCHSTITSQSNTPYPNYHSFLSSVCVSVCLSVSLLYSAVWSMLYAVLYDLLLFPARKRMMKKIKHEKSEIYPHLIKNNSTAHRTARTSANPISDLPQSWLLCAAAARS